MKIVDRRIENLEIANVTPGIVVDFEGDYLLVGATSDIDATKTRVTCIATGSQYCVDNDAYVVPLYTEVVIK